MDDPVIPWRAQCLTAIPSERTCRTSSIYAENPARNFEPCSGLISKVRFPEDVRLDGWVQDGTEVTLYDPLLAKILAHGKPKRSDPKTSGSSSQAEIHGIETNIEYLKDWVNKHWCQRSPFIPAVWRHSLLYPELLRSYGPEPRQPFRTIPEDFNTGM